MPREVGDPSANSQDYETLDQMLKTRGITDIRSLVDLSNCYLTTT